MKKEFLQGYRSFIFFAILTLMQAFFMWKDIKIGKETFMVYIAGSGVFLGMNKWNKLIEKKKGEAQDDNIA